MIEKITPTGVNSIENSISGKKSVKVASEGEQVSDDSSSLSSVTLSAKKYGSIYLKARDTQSNISYMQDRAEALKTVSAKLSQLKNLSYQYDTVKDGTLAEQDKIVASAEQTLYSIDKFAESKKFMGNSVVSDADSKELGLGVINFESDNAQAQIDAAIRKVTAKLAANNGFNAAAEVRLENLQSYSKISNGSINDFQAEEIADSLVNAMDGVSSDDLYSKLDTSNVSELIG